MSSSGCCVAGRSICNFTSVGLKPRREGRTLPRVATLPKLLPRQLDWPEARVYWFGDRGPTDDELGLLQNVFHSQRNIVWPAGFRLRWISSWRLVDHLRAVKDESADTYLLISEQGLARYVANILPALASSRLICHFMATKRNGELVARYTHAINDFGQPLFWQSWCLPPTRAELQSGHWRRPVQISLTG